MTDKLTHHEMTALREFLRVLRQLERAGLAHHAEITVTMRGRSVDVSARIWAGGGAGRAHSKKSATV